MKARAFRKGLFIGVITLCVGAGVGPNVGANARAPAIDVRWGITPTVDGTISTCEYTDANSVSFATSGGTCIVYFKHDGTALYVAFDVPNLDPSSAVQIFVDTQYDQATAPQADDYRFTIAMKPPPNDYGENMGTGTDWSPWLDPDGWSGAFTTFASSWNAEFAISYTKLGITAGMAKTIGISFWNAWTTTGDHHWPTGAVWNNPSTWGAASSSDDWWFSMFDKLFIRGDAEADGDHDIFDGLRIIYWIGGAAQPPPCVNAADAEDDEDVDLFDGLRIIYWIGGVAEQPPQPCCFFPCFCGWDPTPGPLDCFSFPPCGWPSRGAKVVPPTTSVGSAEESRLAIEEAVAENGPVTVPVTLTNAEPLVGFSFIIEYDPELLTAKVVDNAGMITEAFDVFVGGVSEPGMVKVVAVSDMDVADGVNKLPTGEHQVAKITFELKGTLDRDVALDLTEGVMAISHDRALNHTLVDGVIKPTVALPTEFSLSQNYPNPFNPITKIRYDLPVDCHVNLEIYNVLGQRVATLVNGDQLAGYHAVAWDGGDAASGIYVYRIQAGKFKATRKMVLMR